jgi:hypothetical protein
MTAMGKYRSQPELPFGALVSLSSALGDAVMPVNLASLPTRRRDDGSPGRMPQRRPARYWALKPSHASPDHDGLKLSAVSETWQKRKRAR